MTEQLEHLPTLAPWVALALVGLAVLVALAWRRGGPLAALSTVLGALGLWLLTKLATVRPRSRAQSTTPDVNGARADVAQRRDAARADLEQAQEAQELAAAHREAVETEEDVDELVAEGVRRSMGET